MTDTPAVRPARDGDLDAVCALIGRLNARPEQRSLMLDETPGGVRRNLEDLDDPWTARFFVAEDGSRIVGAVGVEWESANGRSRLMGPFVEPAAGDPAFARLLDAAAALIPPGIGTLDAFIDRDAVAVRRGLEAGAFEAIREVLIYTAPLPVTAAPETEPARDLAPGHEAAFLDLHRLCFPDPYMPGEALLDARGDRRRILALTDGPRLTGYLAANLEEGPEEGFVQYVGVVPDLRGRGLGRKLLGQALAWFTERGMPQASLTVEDRNTGARGLYERVGFAVYRSGVVLRKTLTGPAA